MKHLYVLFIALALIAWPLHSSLAAEDHHNHQDEQSHDEEIHEHDSHDEQEGHSHEDGHEHDDHGEETDSHDDHGHENPEQEDEHDSHGHGHDEHGHEEEGKTEIAPDHAEEAGIKLEKAQGGIIAQSITLTGQIILNRDTTASVRARFPGIVREVPVKLGQEVEKGEVLALVESNESLKEYNITAPASGVILKRNTNAGDVTGEEESFVIADLSNVWAKFHIFPKDTAFIRERQEVSVHTLNESMRATAPIRLLLPTADALTQTHIAIVELENKEGRWRPGMTVEGDVAVSEKQAAIVVPETALQTMEGQSVIFVAEDNSYEARPVQTGKSDGRNVEILSGLKAGESFVSEGSFIVKADILKSGAGHDHGH